jgi:hypothetical protein
MPCDMSLQELSRSELLLYLDLLTILRRNILTWHPNLIKYNRSGHFHASSAAYSQDTGGTSGSEDTATPSSNDIRPVSTQHAIHLARCPRHPNSDNGMFEYVQVARRDHILPQITMASTNHNIHAQDKITTTHSLTHHPRTQEPCLPTLPLTLPSTRSWL